MHTETIVGLHRCQPKNEPQVGQVKTFLVIHNPAKQGKKPWIAIKSAAEDKGGTPYKVVSVTPTGWEPDQYQNVSYNLEIEVANGAFQQAKAAMQGEDDETRIVNVDEHGVIHPRTAPQAPPARQNVKDGVYRGGQQGPTTPAERWPGKDLPPRPSMLDERQRAIIRQHSQSMALEVLKLKVTLNELTVEDLTPAKLRQLADYFDQDALNAAEGTK